MVKKFRPIFKHKIGDYLLVHLGHEALSHSIIRISEYIVYNRSNVCYGIEIIDGPFKDRTGFKPSKDYIEKNGIPGDLSTLKALYGSRKI